MSCFARYDEPATEEQNTCHYKSRCGLFPQRLVDRMVGDTVEASPAVGAVETLFVN